jgi:hypothetical protein
MLYNRLNSGSAELLDLINLHRPSCLSLKERLL